MSTIHYNHLLPRMIHVAGITLGSHIYLANLEQFKHMPMIKKLIRHEEIHVEQWKRYGVRGFIWRYIKGFIAQLFGRGKNPLEKEAYDRE